jgi:septal ring-binding cell division protein DamX
MLRLPIMLLFVALLVACSRGGILQSGKLEIPQSTGNWFCQPGAGGDEWDCIQDEELARSPQLAAALPPAAPAQESGEGPEGERPEPAATEPPVPQDVEPRAVQEPPQTEELPAADPEPPKAAEPGLDADGLMGLPDDYFAVQLVALDSAAELSAFVDTHGLGYLPQARVERDGRIHYVLLLGFYESYALAEAASLDPPAPIEPGDAWIRPLAGLKRAVQRAASLDAG